MKKPMIFVLTAAFSLLFANAGFSDSNCCPKPCCQPKRCCPKPCCQPKRCCPKPCCQPKRCCPKPCCPNCEMNQNSSGQMYQNDGNQMNQTNSNQMYQNNGQLMYQNNNQEQAASDWQTTVKVKQALMSDNHLPTSVRFITVRTMDGVITLSGVVATPQEAEMIMSKVRRLPGIRSVDNQLTVSQ